MDKTEEKAIDIDGLKKLFSEVNYAEIILSKSGEWTTEQEKAIDVLLQYTDTKPKINYKNQEDIYRLFNLLDDYMYEIISKIPIEQRAEFFKVINNNIELFFSDMVINETPEFYSIFMKKYFGNDKYQEFFLEEDYLESFDVLQDCPELIKQLDSFPVYQKIEACIYDDFITRLAKNVYSKLPNENKGKAVLSYIRNTKNEAFSEITRNNFIKRVLSENYVFGKQDYKEIITELDRIINEQTIDSVFFDTILNHSTGELKSQFATHLIKRAYSILKEKNDDKTINFFNNALGRSVSEVDLSKFENVEEIIKLFIDNNIGQSLDKFLAASNSKDVIRYFEDFISREEDVMASKNGIVKAFVKNLDFETHNISSQNIASVVNYIINYCDSESLKILLNKDLRGYKQPIINYILKHYKDISEKKPNLDNKTPFLIETIKASRTGAIEKKVGLEMIFDAIGLDMYNKKGFEDNSKKMMQNFLKINYDSEVLVSEVLSKMKEQDAFDAFRVFIYGAYLLTEDNEFNDRSIYAHSVVSWLNHLSQDSIEKFIRESHYLKDKFIQAALKEPEQYCNIVSAIENLKTKIDLPDMNEIDERIKKGDELNSKEIDDYFKKLELIRLKEGIIPEKYCDFAIRNTILTKDQNYDTESNFYIIYPLCVVDKTRHVLEKEGIDGITVFADNKKTTNLGSFSDSSKELNLSVKAIFAMENGIYNIIDTIFHEVRHAVQKKDINNNNIQNISEYDMIKEKLIRKNNFLFYDDNYESLTAEIDARIEGRKKMYQYLQSLGISVEQILEGDIFYNKETKKTYEEYLQEETDRLENPNKKFKINLFETKSLDSIFDGLISKYPNLIKENPSLKYEYNEDGTRKSKIEMLQEYEEMISAPDYVEKPFVLQEHLMTKKYNDDIDSQKNLIFRDAEILQTFMPKTERGKSILSDIISRMKIYEEKLYTNAIQLNKSDNKDEAKKTFSELMKIISSINGYLDRKMDQELMNMLEIDSMVSDEQRAEALSQMKDNHKSKKQEEMQFQRTCIN